MRLNAAGKGSFCFFWEGPLHAGTGAIKSELASLPREPNSEAREGRRLTGNANPPQGSFCSVLLAAFKVPSLFCLP